MEERDRARTKESQSDGPPAGDLGPDRENSDREPASPNEPQLWAGIVANRSSGSGSGYRLVLKLCQELERRGIAPRVAWTPPERHELVAASADDPNCVCLVAAGGDGTVAALLNENPTHPIAILPAGTENLTANHFQHRRHIRRLASTIQHGKSRTIDLGEADGRRFVLMAGFGFDGDVVSRHHKGRVCAAGRVRPTNRAAYVEPILRASFTYKFPEITVKIDDPRGGEVLKGTTVFVFNLPRYALGLPFAPDACDDDGWLDLLVFRKPGPFQALYYLWQVLWRSHLKDPGVTYRKVRQVTISAEAPVPVQLDGDPGGVLGSDREEESKDSGLTSASLPSGPWLVKVLPAAASVLIPVRPSHQPFVPVALATKD